MIFLYIRLVQRVKFLIPSFFLLAFHLSCAQSFNNGILSHNGENRAYRLFIPSQYDGETSIPLLLNFHAGNGSIQDQVDLSDMHTIADTANFMVVYPQALADPTDGGSTNWMRKAPTTFDDVPFIKTLIDTVSSQYNIDKERVYATGYSLGGEFTFELGCRLFDKIAAIAPVARPMTKVTYENCNPNRPLPVMLVMGTNDDTYNGIEFGGTKWYFSASETMNFWAEHNNTETSAVVTDFQDISNMDGSTAQKSTWQNGDQCVSIEHIKIINGGHTWPGSFFGNQDINGSKEIWKFLSKYDINGLIDCETNSYENLSSHTTVQVNPNPFRNFIEIHGLKNTIEYKIFSSLGEEIEKGNLTVSNPILQTSNLPKGLYILKMEGQMFRILKN